MGAKPMKTDTIDRLKTISVPLEDFLNDSSGILNLLEEHHLIAHLVDDTGKPFARIVPYNDAVLNETQAYADSALPLGAARPRKKEKLS